MSSRDLLAKRLEDIKRRYCRIPDTNPFASYTPRCVPDGLEAEMLYSLAQDALIALQNCESVLAAKDAEIAEQCKIIAASGEREAALLGKIEARDARIRELERALRWVIKYGDDLSINLAEQVLEQK